jgi:hypothetical protein
MLARHPIHVEHGPVAGQAAGGHAEVEAPLREVIEHGDAIGELGRMVIGHEEAAGPDAHAPRLHEGLGHEEVGRGVRLPRRGVVLADPRLAEAQLVRPT